MKFTVSSQGPRLWNRPTTKETKALTYDNFLKNINKRFILKYGKRNCLFLKTSKQPLTVLRKLILRRI